MGNLSLPAPFDDDTRGPWIANAPGLVSDEGGIFPLFMRGELCSCRSLVQIHFFRSDMRRAGLSL